MPSSVTIHPSVDHGVKEGPSHFHGGTLHCHCAHNPVLVEVKSQLAAQSRARLHQVLEAQRRQVCGGGCRAESFGYGAGKFGRIENKDHVFYGLDFVHSELSPEKGWAAPEFARLSQGSLITSQIRPMVCPAGKAASTGGGVSAEITLTRSL